jgi:hypothetical protein
MNARDARRMALELPEVTEEPHFHLVSFRVHGKIFATLPPDDVQRLLRTAWERRAPKALLRSHT